MMSIKVLEKCHHLKSILSFEKVNVGVSGELSQKQTTDTIETRMEEEGFDSKIVVANGLDISNRQRVCLAEPAPNLSFQHMTTGQCG